MLITILYILYLSTQVIFLFVLKLIVKNSFKAGHYVIITTFAALNGVFADIFAKHYGNDNYQTYAMLITASSIFATSVEMKNIFKEISATKMVEMSDLNKYDLSKQSKIITIFIYLLSLFLSSFVIYNTAF